ncbi:F-box/LRR-repeat MAX2 homolog A [Cornus florida]|uniref:F-box/LRR-repeat MAX2 homolog A n=1 Tax=Cornus florida TaxID=4283 RepID=UPI002897F8B4|nr:F-box/LRR-repeat MAX2 homolog A [Cornus florida]
MAGPGPGPGPGPSSATTTTTINDLPDVILSNIIAAVSDTRSRNAAALVCVKWLVLERATRTSLTLRGNVRNLFSLPNCFRSVTLLDLSLLSPWGHSLLPDPYLLSTSFPNLTSLTLYSRNPNTLQLLVPQWPQLNHIKLVRWHQRPQLPPGDEFAPLFQHCSALCSLDLSSFYCWTDDIAPALQSFPNLASNLTKLDLLNPSFAEGFKSVEIRAITEACPNLNELKIACMFDSRYIGFVNDEALLSIAANCPKLCLLHLVDSSALLNARGDPNDEGFAQEDSVISVATLVELFSGLPLLEELTLDVCKNVKNSGPALEMLNLKCPKLRSLKLGQFHGLCTTIDSRLDGIALCQGIEALSIKNSADLTDMGLIAIARGCSRLAKFEVEGCKKITMRGMRTLACLLRRTLVDVKISCCNNLGAASSIKALEPIQDRIQRIHIDCVWDSVEQLENFGRVEYNFDLNEPEEERNSKQTVESANFFQSRDYEEICKRKKKCKYADDLSCSSRIQSNGNGHGYCHKTWDSLRYLSLWIAVGELLTPLQTIGLENCPNLEEIRIRVEGDCREWSRPSERAFAFGLSSLTCFPRLSKMHLDCGDTIGYAHTAPFGQMDLSLWERFYLFGIGNLNLNELDYWPPQDRDVNQRSLSLPAAGLLAECATLRKLFIHGTAHEHFMNFLLRIPNLRDVQLREDYYPAPENDMSTEMRVDSCSRFEESLNRRQISD